MSRNYTRPQVIDALKRKGYKLYEDGKPNIVGVRSRGRSAGTYDDVAVVFWKDHKTGSWIDHFYTITTDPGLTYLKNPLDAKGCAILVPGQYIDCYQLGMHRGKHEALIQTGGPVRVYRDGNKDGILDTDPAKIDSGFFGINLHHGSLEDGEIINGNSAGCQVWRFNVPHQMMIQEFKNISKALNFKNFTYTLIEENDIA